MKNLSFLFLFISLNINAQQSLEDKCSALFSQSMNLEITKENKKVKGRYHISKDIELKKGDDLKFTALGLNFQATFSLKRVLKNSSNLLPKKQLISIMAMPN